MSTPATREAPTASFPGCLQGFRPKDPFAFSPAEEMRVFSSGWDEVNTGLSNSCQQKARNQIREGIYKSCLLNCEC